MALKVAVFTANFGGKDDFLEPLNFKNEGDVDYFFITDERSIASKFHTIIYKEAIYDDIAKNARYYKIQGLDLFHKYEYVIWHDANIQMNHEEILNLIGFASNNGLAFFSHSQRRCVFDEAIKCIALDKDDPFKLLKQALKYFSEGIENNMGLYETGLYVKNNRFIDLDFIKLWWDETRLYSRRDQISLPYCLKKLQMVPAIITGNIRKNKYSIFHMHKYRQYKFMNGSKKKPFIALQKLIAIKIIQFVKIINRNK